jgi:hypothetical protein
MPSEEQNIWGRKKMEKEWTLKKIGFYPILLRSVLNKRNNSNSNNCSSFYCSLYETLGLVKLLFLAIILL